MKKNYIVPVLIVIISCLMCILCVASFKMNRKPDFIADGVPYIIRKSCEKDSTWMEYGYHYGYNFSSGDFSYHLGWHREYKCTSYKLDTLKFNQ